MENKTCNHSWKQIAKEKRVNFFTPATFFKDGQISYEYRILQMCDKCGKQEVIIF